MPLARTHAVDAMVEMLRAHAPGTVTLCPTGPLTNVAMALRKAPDVVPRIKEIVLMGGAIGLGNVTPAAEFNIYVDPHAAKVVFEAGVPLVMLGLDVTHQALLTPDRLDAIRALGTPLSRTVVELLEFYGIYDQARRGRVGAPLHDPCVIAYLLNPALFGGRACHVAIETQGEHTLGRTVVDWSRRTRHAPNATVINEIEAAGFFAMLTERLGRLPLRSAGAALARPAR
jgi:purine nucleosidase